MRAGKANIPMTEIIGVRFKNAGKTYYFSPKGEKITSADKVIVETARGVESVSYTHLDVYKRQLFTVRTSITMSTASAA